MKFKKYVAGLNALLIERPETADLNVVTCKDDEGKGFNPVCFTASVGNYDEEDQEFTEERPINAVCVN